MSSIYVLWPPDIAYLFEQILTVALNGNSLYNQSAFHLPFKL